MIKYKLLKDKDNFSFKFISRIINKHGALYTVRDSKIFFIPL